MNKKGFTLVELLAVIAILAILVVMAMPNVLDMFNNTKKNNFKNEVKTIIRQVGTDYMSFAISDTVNGGDGTYSNKSGVTGAKELSLTTNLTYQITVANGKITSASVNDGTKYCYTQTGADITVNNVEFSENLACSTN